MIPELVEATTQALQRGGITAGELDEVRGLAERPPSEASIAVVGPHNAGKTTLIAVVTRDPRAVEDISSVVQTSASTSYRYSSGATAFELWDTPGLGSEHLDHDEEARDRITRADAVVLAISPDLVSQKGRDQLAELLHIGRKRGAVLPVVTKADREPLDNRTGIALTLREALPQLGRDFAFVAAGEVLDARLEDEEEPEDTGMTEFISALEDLATGEARRRVQATAAIRLLALSERAEERLGAEEPEQEVALTFQRRLRKVLVRTDRRLVEALDNASRKQRLNAFRSVATIGESIDKGGEREKVDVAIHAAWDSFILETRRLEDELSSSLQARLEESAVELERLESGPLADALRATASELDTAGLEQPAAPAGPSGEFGQQLINAAQRAAKLLRTTKIAVGGKKVAVGVVAGVGLEALQWHLDSKTAEAIAAAKEELRQGYSAKADEAIDRWTDYVDAVRDETTRNALARADEVEQELFAGLSDMRRDLEALASSRNRLNAYLEDAIAAGYADPELASA